MYDSDKPRISNLEGLKNPTILQQLNAMKQYVIDHAIQGPEGPTGAPGKDGTNGTDGAPGISLSALEAINYEEIGDYTVTTVRATYTNGVQTTFDIQCKNGVDGTDGTNGTDGAPGATGPQGPQGPQGNSVTRVNIVATKPQPPYTIFTLQFKYGPEPEQVIGNVDIYTLNGTNGATGKKGAAGAPQFIVEYKADSIFTILFNGMPDETAGDPNTVILLTLKDITSSYLNAKAGDLIKPTKGWYISNGDLNIEGPPAYDIIGNINGNGIDSIVSISHSTVDDETITNLQVNFTDPDKAPQTVEIHAQNGVATIPYITINAPATATEGTLTAAQMTTLNSNPLAYIMFDNEIYYPMDKEHDAGYLTYVHNGVTEQGATFVEKAITVLINGNSWKLTTATEPSGGTKLYIHKITFTSNPSAIRYSNIQIISPRSEAYTLSTFDEDIVNGKIFGIAQPANNFIINLNGNKFSNDIQLVEFALLSVEKPINIYSIISLNSDTVTPL